MYFLPKNDKNTFFWCLELLCKSVDPSPRGTVVMSEALWSLTNYMSRLLMMEKSYFQKSFWFTIPPPTPKGKKSPLLQFLQYFGHKSINFRHRDLKKAAYEPDYMGLDGTGYFSYLSFCLHTKIFRFSLKNGHFFCIGHL